MEKNMENQMETVGPFKEILGFWVGLMENQISLPAALLPHGSVMLVT